MATPEQLEEENAIAFLNMHASKNGKAPPEYKEKDMRGEPHKRTFTLTCEFVGLEVCCEGKSKKEAKKKCAVYMVRKMRKEGLLSTQSMEYEPVAALQQILQKKGYPVPKYEEVGATGLSHCKQFTIRVTASYPDGRMICEPSDATASSKKEAKKKAADDLLTRVKQLLDTSPLVKQTTSFSSSSSSISSMLSNNDENIRSTSNQLFAHHETSSLNSSLNETCNKPHISSLNTGMASLNMDDTSYDTTDDSCPVELPNDIDVVFVDGDDKKLCLATVCHDGEKITGCGHGNSRETAKQSAIDNLTSNFRVLYTPIKI